MTDVTPPKDGRPDKVPRQSGRTDIRRILTAGVVLLSAYAGIDLYTDIELLDDLEQQIKDVSELVGKVRERGQSVLNKIETVESQFTGLVGELERGRNVRGKMTVELALIRESQEDMEGELKSIKRTLEDLRRADRTARRAAEHSGLVSPVVAIQAKPPPPSPDTARPFIWAQMAPDAYVTGNQTKKAGTGGMIARIVLPPGSRCPEIMVDHRPHPMHTRAPMTRTDFPVTLCEHRYDGGSEASVLGKTLPGRPSQLNRVLVIGDTGCRITFYLIQAGAVQDCNNAGEWPLRTLAEHLAREGPFDLILHVGDYHYLEASCPDSLKACRGKPAGDRWDSWKADFFDPIRPLLLKAPWVMVRGNHEDCERAGTGWLHLLGPERLRDGAPAACRDDTDPYWLGFDNVSLLVLDTANAGSPYGANARAERYRSWLQRAFGAKPADHTNAPAWLISQEPVWQWPYKNNAEKNEEGIWLAGIRSASLKEAAFEVMKRAARDENSGQRFELVVSGDTHVFEALVAKTSTSYPWQLIFGMSGTALDDRDKEFAKFPSPVAGPHELKLSLSSDRNEYLDMEVYLISEFGYGVLERQNDRWTAEFHALDGTTRAVCPLSDQVKADQGRCALTGGDPS